MLNLCQPEGTGLEGCGAAEPTVFSETLPGAVVWTPESALCLSKVCFRCLCPLRKPGALGGVHKEVVSDRGSLSMLASEQELEHREHAELPGVIVLSPAEEAEHLLVSE